MLATLRDVKMGGFQVLPWSSLQSSTESKTSTDTNNHINSLSLCMYICVYIYIYIYTFIYIFICNASSYRMYVKLLTSTSTIR